jgi:MerR family mercuric resistance operon transcriptional regulator
LLVEPDRNGGVRRYNNQDLTRLRFIRTAQTAGFTLAEISELLALDATSEHERARELANNRIEEIDKKIDALKKARQSLRRLADECAEGLDGRCPIIGAFEPDSL